MGEALTQLFESDARFEPCERLAQAEMLALTKIELTVPWAVDINCVGSIKLPLISTSRSSHQGDARTLWDRHSMHFESTARGSPLELRGGIEPQEFFDGLRNQMRFVPDPLPKRWIPEEVDQRVPDELGRRLCTGLTEKRDEANHLRIGQMLGLSIGVLVLRLRKNRHEIVLRFPSSLLQDFTHEIARLHPGLHGPRSLLAGVRVTAQCEVGPFAERLSRFLGKAHEGADDFHRIFLSELGLDVKSLPVHERIEEPAGGGTHLGLQRVDSRRSKPFGDQLAKHVLARRVHRDDHARLSGLVAIGQIMPQTRAVALPIQGGFPDVFEPEECVEIHFGVVVAGLLVSKTLIGGIRVVLHLSRVRVIDHRSEILTSIRVGDQSQGRRNTC